MLNLNLKKNMFILRLKNKTSRLFDFIWMFFLFCVEYGHLDIQMIGDIDQNFSTRFRAKYSNYV